MPGERRRLSCEPQRRGKRRSPPLWLSGRLRLEERLGARWPINRPQAAPEMGVTSWDDWDRSAQTTGQAAQQPRQQTEDAVQEIDQTGHIAQKIGYRTHQIAKRGTRDASQVKRHGAECYLDPE